MAQKNKVRSLRVSPQLDARITSYALSTNQKEADAIRDLIEKGLARVCSRGTKASPHTAMMLTDVSRAIVPAWRNANGEGIWRAYARAGEELQAGKSYAEAKAGMRK